MTTPVDDFVRAYAQSGVYRAHMPGHKGLAPGEDPADITEITGADSLYDASGILLESERNAQALFGSHVTVYSTEGASLAIRAMLRLALDRAPQTDRRPRLVAGRNAHRALLSAAALLDFDIDWLYPRTGGILSSQVPADALEAALRRAETKPFAVYVTSPDYLGHLADISGMAAVCRRYGVALLVDNAHGAYLRFLPQSRHPLDLGADMCADSAHKTLPVLTGGAYLHVSRERTDIAREDVKAAMSLFASTSPSYLILASLDRCNRALSTDFPQALAALATRMDALRDQLSGMGVPWTGDEPLKLTLRAVEGCDGMTMKRLLRARNIECEMADPDHVTLMLAPPQAPQLDGIFSALLDACAVWAGHAPCPPPALPAPGERVMTIRQATLAPQITLPAEHCLGRVLGSDTTGCPPAVPLAVSGERLTAEALRLCQYYGQSRLRVVVE